MCALRVKAPQFCDAASLILSGELCPNTLRLGYFRQDLPLPIIQSTIEEQGREEKN